ncbi:hypothetical protein DM01DRAFT_1407422 [Hesseltinella vesiculosa]|uniref:Elongation of fatty acids protein n=1 Tax=Hesseltinella vesiculosa TaxID=101127 RepID=A0A1X2GIR6_9FUNG|nr:hypothetical protein DM01DRAFT_1407422 [Hesseltinella vesiculosa]
MSWDWYQLLPTRADEFKWIYGRTPLSNMWVLYGSWLLYFGGVIYVRWIMAERRRIDRGHPFIVIYNGSMLLTHFCVWTTGAWTMYHHLDISFFDYHCHPYQLRGRFFYGIFACYLLRYCTFLDTLVLVLRKKPIQFLHWYQHMFAPLILWSWLDDQSIFGGAAIIIMSLVLVARYAYYFCLSLSCGPHVQTTLKVLVIMTESVQTAAGLFLTAYQRVHCPQSSSVLLSACINITIASIAITYDQKPTAPVTRLRRKSMAQLD